MEVGRRRVLAGMGIAALGLMLSGCAEWIAPRSVIVSQADIEKALARRFPMKEKLLEVFEVEVALPSVRLLPERNRIATDLTLGLSDRLFGGRYAGRLAVDHALRYDEHDHSVKLADVHVERFEISGADGTLQGRAQRIGTLVAERLLDGVVIHRLKPEQAERLDRSGLRAAQPRVTERGIEIRLDAATG